MDIIKQYQNWRKFGVERSYIESKWTEADLIFAWEKTFQTDEVPENDAWSLFTTNQKINLQNIQKSWGVKDTSTEHWMSFSPTLPKKIGHILNPFKKYTYSYNLLKLDPGHMLVWHYDIYSTFVKRHNLTQDQAEKIHRSAIMLTDWNCGQMLQVGNDVLTHWSKGDTFTWQSYTWHGLCNFGPEQIILAQVSFLKD